MRLKIQLETVEIEDSIIAVPVGEQASIYQGVIKLNEVGADILHLLNNDITEEKIADELEGKYEVKRDKLLSDIHLFIDEFNKRGLLVE